MRVFEEIVGVWDRLCAPNDCAVFVKGARPQGTRVHTPSTLLTVLENAQRADADAYVHLNTSVHDERVKAKGSRNDITELRHILIDVDSPNTPDLYDRFWRVLCGLNLLDASMLISSGRGLQAWVCVEGLSTLDEPSRDLAEALSRAVVLEVQRNLTAIVDTCTTDLARIGRPPGSWNTRAQTHARLLKAATCRMDSGYLIERFRPQVVKRVVPQPLAKTFKWNLPMALPRLSMKAASFLVEGVGSPGRHSAAFAAGASLRDAGVPKELALSWVARGAGLCSPKLNEREALNAAENAYRKEQK